MGPVGRKVIEALTTRRLAYWVRLTLPANTPDLLKLASPVSVG